MVVFRGRGAASKLDQLRCEDGLAVQLSCQSEVVQKLLIVQSHKHLGGVICIDGNIMKEVAARAASAMQVYGPLACRVFVGATLFLLYPNYMFLNP